ncbi:MAG: hypothetical protein ABI891_03965 [Acidobacteriota bacterium]
MRDLISWAVAFIFYGFGLGVLQVPNPKRVIASKVFFILGAVSASGVSIMSLISISDNLVTRLIISFCVFGFIGAATVEAIRFAAHTEPTKSEIPPAFVSANVELKKAAKQLSNEILQFVSDRNSNRPQFPMLDPTGIKANKDGTVAKKSLSAYNKFKEERDRQNQITLNYYQETQNDFIQRYSVRYQNILNDLVRQDVDLTGGYTAIRAQTNPLTMQGAAVWLGGLAEQLPDTK